MVHLPAANGASPRTIHRSKWFGASRLGRKYLEALICRDVDGSMLCRRNQRAFRTDGVVAERVYVNGCRELYFVPDHLQALAWSIDGPCSTTLDLYFDMRYQRGSESEHGYFAAVEGPHILVSRTVEIGSHSSGEGPDSGGTPVTMAETLWAACRLTGGSMMLNPPQERWRPMWYSLDATRRRYLRMVARRDVPAVEHAPLWELTTQWVYSPAAVSFPDCGSVVLGFGHSHEEAVLACDELHARRSELEEEKRKRLSQLANRSRFVTGHPPTDSAYKHVLARVIDCLVIEGNGDRDGAAILAGDAYFQESWKRDENIALGGLLAAGRYDLARRIVNSTWQDQDPQTGRLPLRHRAGEIPGYTSSDGTLWALVRLRQYVEATGDSELLHEKLGMVVIFFRRSLEACRHGLLPSGGVAVAEHEWETWMDTEFSARSGYPIEIQLLWLACLTTFGPLVQPIDGALSRQMAAACGELRDALARYERDDHFVDALDRTLGPVDLFTPNGYFWSVLGLDFGWEWEERSLAAGMRELAGISGVRTLARSQWESVLGTGVAGLARANRPLPSVGKVNYHRGVEWNWLAQLFVAAHLRHGHPDLAFDHHLTRQIFDSTTRAGLGGVSEVFDHRGPAGPDFQAWSMTGLIESLHRFAGIHVDVPANFIVIAPQKPRRWPHIRVRKSFADAEFDVDYEHTTSGQRLKIAFAAAPPEWPTLRVELPCRRPSGPKRVAVGRGGSDAEHWPFQVLEHPSRVMLSFPATKEQVITTAY